MKIRKNKTSKFRSNALSLILSLRFFCFGRFLIKVVIRDELEIKVLTNLILHTFFR